MTVAWVIFVIAMLAYFQLSAIKEFDPKRQLHQPQWLTEFKLQTDWQRTGQGRLIIVIDVNCGCTLRANAHITQLQALAQKHNLSVQRLVNDDALLTIVPNTPAAILLNKHGELVYAGPLSEGIACSTGSGFVELAINNLQAGFNSNLKLSQAKGCYCHSP